MQTIAQLLEQKFRQAFTAVGISYRIAILLVEATRAEFGDFQVNGVMAAAKQLKVNPRELAQQIIKLVDLTDLIEKLEVAGPGFINITLKNSFLADYINKLTKEKNFGVPSIQQKVVVDLSSPNLAKEMHVGHLRSTVIGDSLSRIFEYMGNSVIRQNHVGDWGTQFGMLITNLIANSRENSFALKLSDLEQFYREAKEKFDIDPQFAKQSRNMVVALQSNNGEQAKLARHYWQEFTQVSLNHCQEIYAKLKVKLTINDVRGESAYNNDLPKIINELEEKHLIIESNGAKCVFFKPDELLEGKDTPFIVQKQDGGFLYSTTDLAALKYRVHTLKADRIVYVVDARQALHFKQLFIIGKKAGFAKATTCLEHSSFGTMMNEEGRPFKTREGGTVKLIDLINTAINKAYAMVNLRNPAWLEQDKIKLAEILAIGAIKYADLSKNRTSDYIFSLDKMLAFEGNTAPYLLYAYTRVQSILKKASLKQEVKIILKEEAEHKLALHLAKFADTLTNAALECYPHYICQYLYNLSTLFMQFYESCPILKAREEEIQQSRLALANLTAKILKTGLELLGIEVVDRM